MDAADFLETIHVHGTASTSSGMSAPLAFSVTYPKYRPGPLRVQGIVTDSNCDRFEIASASRYNKVQVWGQLPSGEVLRLENPHFNLSKETGIDGSCSGFTHGIESPLEFTGGKYKIVVTLPYVKEFDTPISETTSYLGTIESARSATDGIKWQSHLGGAALTDIYCYERPFEQRDMLVRVKKAVALFEGEITNTVVPLEFVSVIEEEMDDPLRLLSFLSRSILRWFEIEASFQPSDADNFSRWSFVKRRDSRSRVDVEKDSVLSQPQLAQGGFEVLLKGLRASPIKDWLRTAMVYVGSSHQKQSLEDSLAAAYLALEALSLGFARSTGTETVLVGQDDEKFLSLMQSTIEAFCKEGSIEADVKQQLIGSVKSSPRTSLKRRVKALIEDKQIPTEDLWPPGTKFSEGLQRVIDRRNKFIHEAKIPSPHWPISKDMQRIQDLVERSILVLLGWNPSQIDASGHGYSWLRDDD